MSDQHSSLPVEGEPVVDALGMDGVASDPGSESGDAIDVAQDTGIDAAGDGGETDGPAIPAHEPSDAAPATQDSAAAETNGLP
jgi:hypothetical protein